MRWGLFVGSLGPLNLVLWRLYRHLTRFDPSTGHHGLVRLDVMLLVLALFLGTGLAAGLIWARLRRPQPPDD